MDKSSVKKARRASNSGTEERFLEVLQEMSRICGGSSGSGSLDDHLPLSAREREALQSLRCSELGLLELPLSSPFHQNSKNASDLLQESKNTFTHLQNSKKVSALLHDSKNASALLEDSKNASNLYQESQNASNFHQESKNASTHLEDIKKNSAVHQDNKYLSSSLHETKQNKKASKRKYHRKKSINDSKFETMPKQRSNSVSHNPKQGGQSPGSSSSFDSAICDIYSSSIQTPKSDPTPEESALMCDISVPFEAVLQENCFVNPCDVGGQDPGDYPLEQLTDPAHPKFDRLPKISEISRPAASHTPPALREQRRRYQRHIQLTVHSNTWFDPVNYRRDVARRQELETICMDLLRRYQEAVSAHPPSNPALCMTGDIKTDPLLVATRLLSQSLARLRFFLWNLECMYWLSMEDRARLYSSNICTVAVLKASIGLDMLSLPLAYPLPYGEYLAETEALQLITAHDLYNELRSIVATVQSLGIREFPIMLLVIMAAFFRETEMIKGENHFNPSTQRILKVQHYYNNKLQVYLELRCGETESYSMLQQVYLAVDKINTFSNRLRLFLAEVTRVGLQRQYEPVCENLGLIAYILQCEPCQ